jgi:hypothetical protein
MEDITEAIFIQFMGEHGESLLKMSGQDLQNLLNEEDGNASLEKYIN